MIWRGDRREGVGVDFNGLRGAEGKGVFFQRKVATAQPKGGDWTGASPQSRPFRKIDGMRRSSLSVALFERGGKTEDRTGVEYGRPLFLRERALPDVCECRFFITSICFSVCRRREGPTAEDGRWKGTDRVGCSPHTEDPSGKLRQGGPSSGREVAKGSYPPQATGVTGWCSRCRLADAVPCCQRDAATRSKEKGPVAPFPRRCAGDLQRGGGSCSVLAALLGKGALPIKETAFAARGWPAGRRRLWWVTGRGEISGWRAAHPPPVKRGRPVRGGAPPPAGAGR